MKSIINFFVLTFLIIVNVYAQSEVEAYIIDPDGYTNVRSERSVNAEITSTIETGELFNCKPDSKSNWWYVTKNDGKTGFVHKSRITTVDSKSKEITKLFDAIRTADPNDVEFGEGSNEDLFMYAEKFPKAFVLSFEGADEETSEKIVKELEMPIHDLIDLKLIYRRISELEYHSPAKRRILEALK